MTYEGIARAFNRKLEYHEPTIELMEKIMVTDSKAKSQNKDKDQIQFIASNFLIPPYLFVFIT